MTTQQELDRLATSRVLDATGEDLGQVGDVYLDDDTGRPEWVTVKTDAQSRQVHFVPLVDAQWVGESIQVPHDKRRIENSPGLPPEESLSVAQEEDLYRYYRIPAQRRREGLGSITESAPGTATGTAAGAAAGTAAAGRTEQERPGAEEEISTIRSEERMRVGTERREAGRVHLRKYVVTTPVERTVPVSHEEVEVEREPITGAETGRGRPLAEGEQEVILHEERPVVETESVPVERVRVRAKKVEGEETVRGELRREEVEIEEERTDTASREREQGT